jgi:hypothetical protein
VANLWITPSSTNNPNRLKWFLPKILTWLYKTNAMPINLHQITPGMANPFSLKRGHLYFVNQGTFLSSSHYE